MHPTAARPGTEIHTSGGEFDLLASIYQHRLISTDQLHRLHGHHRSRRATQRHLQHLAERGLAAAHRPSRRADARWYAITSGAELAELLQVRRRPYRISPVVAAGATAAHTLAVNEVGCILVEAARARGDEFGPWDWEHEIAHPYRPGHATGTDHLVIADAVIYYTAGAPDGTQVNLVRFLELDRGTASTELLVRKIRRYCRLYDYAPRGVPLWRDRYVVFPRLLIALDGLSVPRLQRRRDALIGLCRDEAEIVKHAGPISPCVALLPELTERGPFAGVFQPLIPHPEYGDQVLTLLRRPEAS